MNITEIINQIEADKKARNIFPTYALFMEIAKVHGNIKEARSELNKLYLDGKIKIGETANDRYELI